MAERDYPGPSEAAALHHEGLSFSDSPQHLVEGDGIVYTSAPLQHVRSAGVLAAGALLRGAQGSLDGVLTEGAWETLGTSLLLRSATRRMGLSVPVQDAAHDAARFSRLAGQEMLRAGGDLVSGAVSSAQQAVQALGSRFRG